MTLFVYPTLVDPVVSPSQSFSNWSLSWILGSLWHWRRIDVSLTLMLAVYDDGHRRNWEVTTMKSRERLFGKSGKVGPTLLGVTERGQLNWRGVFDREMECWALASEIEEWTWLSLYSVVHSNGGSHVWTLKSLERRQWEEIRRCTRSENDDLTAIEVWGKSWK